MCYMILAGKNACADRAILAGHNNDLQGHHGTLYEFMAAAEHGPDETIELSSGLVIPQPQKTFAGLILKTWRGYMEGDAVAINEHGVAIAGGVDLGVDRNLNAQDADPLRPQGMSGAARYLALQQAKTSRECIEILGDYYNRYGISYTCGVGVVDRNEAWYIEAGGGSTWVALRVPDDCYMAQANGYRIGEFDADDSDNCICSPDLMNFVSSRGLWNPSKEPFHFAKAFGGKMLSQPHTNRFNPRRIWGCLRHLNPSMELDAQSERHPLFLRPEKPITLDLLQQLLRDQYEDTMYHAFPHEGGYGTDRPVCVPSCVHSTVVELRDNLPVDIGSVIWGCLASPSTSPYVACHFGTGDLPSEFKTSGPDYDDNSAFWHFRALSNLSMVNPQKHVPLIADDWKPFEYLCRDEARLAEQKALAVYDKDKAEACRILTESAMTQHRKALDLCKKIQGQVHTRIAQDVHAIFSVPELEW